METILSIAGKPGLYRMVSRGNNTLIVESLDEKKRRFPAFSSDRITSLGDIAMYTDDEDIELWKVLKAVGEKENLQKSSLNVKKCSAEELHTYFGEVLPTYDHERVHDSDMKKLVQWYNILVEAGYTDFESMFAIPEEPEAEEKTEE